MTPHRWQQISELYRAALARDGDERVAFLKKACQGDGRYEELESLLAQPGSFRDCSTLFLPVPRMC
jgi:hypothetical protein